MRATRAIVLAKHFSISPNASQGRVAAPPLAWQALAKRRPVRCARHALHAPLALHAPDERHARRGGATAELGQTLILSARQGLVCIYRLERRAQKVLIHTKCMYFLGRRLEDAWKMCTPPAYFPGRRKSVKENNIYLYFL